MLENLALGAAAIVTPFGLFITFASVTIGIFFGAIPGLSVTMVMALFMPISFTLQPLEGISLLVGLYIGGMAGGLISAILINIPGHPSSVATCFDGYPMTQKGEAMKALGFGVVCSFCGALLSIIVMILVAPNLAAVAVRFGPFEYFSITLFTLTLIASLAGDSMIKGLLAGLFGMLCATIGMAPIDAVTRFTFGSVQLMANLNILTVLIGMFALAEIMVNSETSRNEGKMAAIHIDTKSIRGFGFSWAEFKGQIVNILRSAGIGIGIGVLPGIGGSTINLMAYTAAKNQSKYPEKFGTGVPDGVVATETSNSASIGGAMVPLLTLGIPGDMSTAILLGGFMIHGLTPGPLLFTEHPSLVYGIFVSMIIANFFMLLVEFPGLRLFVKVLHIPKYILMPIIFTLCVVGAFGLNNRIFDTFVVIFFGIIGYLFLQFKLPVAPFIMGFILGPMSETFLRRALMISRGDFTPFLTRPISGAFVIITAIYLTFMIVRYIRQKPKLSA